MSRLRHLQIRSKLILMMLGISGLVLVVTAAVGYVSGREAIEDRVLAQLTGLRVAKANQLTLYVDGLRRHVLTMSRTPMVLEAVQELSAGYDALPAPSPAADSALAAHYRQSFLPELVTEGTPILAAFLPETPQARTLQTLYLAGVEASDRAGRLTAGDGSDYSAAHARYHPSLRRLAAQFDSYDLFLIDTQGRIVYTVAKETDFGTSLVDGPYAASNLADLAAAVRGQKGSDYVGVADFAFYTPSYGAPAAFLAAPLYDGPRYVGVVALQMPAEEISDLMTDGRQWAASGLGESGEIYLVGRDQTMRSDSRLFLEDSAAYVEAVTEQGMDAETVARVQLYDTTILLQPAASEATDLALSGEAGTERIAGDYLGQVALSSFAPVSLGGLDWAIVAEVGLDEAYAPVVRFQRRVLATAAILSVLVTLLALVLAARFLRPIRTLTLGARQIAGGDYDADLATSSRDEFGEMGDAFTGMIAALRGRVASAEEQRETTETALLRFLPDPLHDRREDGNALYEEPSVREIPNVTVVMARLEGYETVLQSLDARALVETLDEVVGAIDTIRLQLGVEKVRMTGDTYLAACGLTTPHLDHARRALDFAVEVSSIVRRYARDRGIPLSVRTGVATGTVVAGVIGEDKLAYGLWGETVSQEGGLLEACPPFGVMVSERTHERVQNVRAFEPQGPGWLLVTDDAASAPTDNAPSATTASTSAAS